jgi:hypothetical protein
MVVDMASTTSPARHHHRRECFVDKDVHVIDGCSAPTWQRVKVCSGCFERPDLCAC